jgi:transcriptional regulator with XRE-family HTH domain
MTGISASYLNLIEHNRRRIGGKLLIQIADALDVEPTHLTEGAGAALIASLREAASDLPEVATELDRVDEFAGRFPGWAGLLVATSDRVSQLERSVETLIDRMTHDPHLAASLHEILSTVTAIRSAASILAEPGDIDPDWQARFHRTIYEDSGRLAATSRGLVTYLEADNAQATETGAPQEELDAALEAADHHVVELEQGGDVRNALKRLGRGMSTAGRSLLEAWLTRYAKDALELPIAMLAPALEAHGPDPVAIARLTGVETSRVMRRLAAMPRDVLAEPVGLAICDGSGVLSYRKPLPDFPMPRFGAACPLWPLYRALNRPFMVLAGVHVPVGRSAAPIWTEALAMPTREVAVNDEPLFEAHMLVRPVPLKKEQPPREELGVACRICPRIGCHARREPSILGTS